MAAVVASLLLTEGSLGAYSCGDFRHCLRRDLLTAGSKTASREVSALRGTELSEQSFIPPLREPTPQAVQTGRGRPSGRGRRNAGMRGGPVGAHSGASRRAVRVGRPARTAERPMNSAESLYNGYVQKIISGIKDLEKIKGLSSKL